MIVLFFGSSSCEKCEQAYIVLSELLEAKDLVYIDSGAEETQDLCDHYDVDSLPHVVVINDAWETAYEIRDLKFLPELVAFLRE